MTFSHPRNRHHRIQCAGFFIAVVIVHVAAIQSIKPTQKITHGHEENISFLESFAVQDEEAIEASDAIQASDSIQSKDVLIEPDGIPPPKDTSEKKIKPTRTTRNDNTINHNTDELQTRITPPSAHASVLNNPPPAYPRQSRRRGEQGKVVLAAEIASNGKAKQALVNISSGYPRLDQAAMESVLKWQFIPGKKAGVPQVMWVNIPINFVLE